VGIKYLWNVGKFLPDYRRQSSHSPPWKFENSKFLIVDAVSSNPFWRFFTVIKYTWVLFLRLSNYSGSGPREPVASHSLDWSHIDRGWVTTELAATGAMRPTSQRCTASLNYHINRTHIYIYTNRREMPVTWRIKSSLCINFSSLPFVLHALSIPAFVASSSTYLQKSKN
jgi:hypothetical protein